VARHIGERGRILVRFELREPELIAWGSLGIPEPGAYAVVQWQQQAHPTVVPLREPQEMPDRWRRLWS